MRQFTLIALLAVAFLSSACARTAPQAPRSTLSAITTATPGPVHQTCVPPVAKLAYPVGVPPSPDGKYPEIDPLGEWQLQAHLTESLGVGIPSVVTKAQEVWILGPDAHTVLRYQPDTGNWRSYHTIDNYSVVPRNLVVSSDGTLWGIATVSSDNVTAHDFPFLSRYNEVADRFEFVRDVDGLLDKVLVISSPLRVSEDSTGQLWFFGSAPGQDVGLFSFDPTTLKAEKHLALPLGYVYTGPVLAPDGYLWFYSGGPQRHLFKYSLTAQEAQPYLGMPNFDSLGHVGNLFADRNGRLWIDNKGWLDFSNTAVPVWYEIIPSSVFLTDHGYFPLPVGDGLVSKYGWLLPLEITQSSNGWLWFTTGGGTIRLEPDQGEWCLFTSGSSPVVEDSRGNAWIVVFDKLYRYHM